MKSETLDILFMDIVMDEMDAYEVTGTLTNDSIKKAIPIFLSVANLKQLIGSG